MQTYINSKDIQICKLAEIERERGDAANILKIKSTKTFFNFPIQKKFNTVKCIFLNYGGLQSQ